MRFLKIVVIVAEKGGVITGCLPTHRPAIPQPRPTTESLGSFVLRHHPTFFGRIMNLAQSIFLWGVLGDEWSVTRGSNERKCIAGP